MLKYRWLFTFTLMVVFLVSGCSSLIPPLVQGWFTVTSVDSAETSGPAEPVEETVPAVNCPETTDGTKLLKVSRNGYCLLYPQAYSVVHANDMQMSILIGGLLNVSNSRLDIIVEDAHGRTAEEAATALVEEFEGFDLSVSFGVMVGGEGGFIVDNVPGQEINRQVFVVHNGRLYKFLFAPTDPGRGQAYNQMETLYDTVINSFTFISPSAPTALPVPAQEPTQEPAPDPATFLPTPEEIQQTMALSSYLVEGLPNPLPAPEGWTIQPCEGTAPVLCIETDAGEMGAFSLDAYALRTYPDLYPILAKHGMPFGSIDVESQIYQEEARLVLEEMVTGFLASVTEDRNVGHPGWIFTPLASEPIQMGALPALSYGFVMADKDNIVRERVLAHVVFDESHIYFVVAAYDPAAHWTLPSDEALLTLAPYLRQIVAELPLPKDNTWHSQPHR